MTAMAMAVVQVQILPRSLIYKADLTQRGLRKVKNEIVNKTEGVRGWSK